MKIIEGSTFDMTVGLDKLMHERKEQITTFSITIKDSTFKRSYTIEPQDNGIAKVIESRKGAVPCEVDPVTAYRGIFTTVEKHMNKHGKTLFKVTQQDNEVTVVYV